MGKTVLLFQTIERLLSQGIEPLKISFISIETPIYNNIGLERLFTLSRQATGQIDPKGWFVFFDEIQYLKDWEVHLKSLVDSYPYTRFIVSGSAAAALKLKSNESGAGRFTEFMLPPLTFNEFLHLKDLDRLIVEKQIEWDGNLSSFLSEGIRCFRSNKCHSFFSNNALRVGRRCVCQAVVLFCCCAVFPGD